MADSRSLQLSQVEHFPIERERSPQMTQIHLRWQQLRQELLQQANAHFMSNTHKPSAEQPKKRYTAAC